MPSLFMARLDCGRTRYFVWVSTNLFIVIILWLFVLWGGFFSTPCAKEEPSPLLIYSIFDSSKKKKLLRYETCVCKNKKKIHAIFYFKNHIYCLILSSSTFFFNLK